MIDKAFIVEELKRQESPDEFETCKPPWRDRLYVLLKESWVATLGCEVLFLAANAVNEAETFLEANEIESKKWPWSIRAYSLNPGDKKYSVVLTKKKDDGSFRIDLIFSGDGTIKCRVFRREEAIINL